MVMICCLHWIVILNKESILKITPDKPHMISIPISSNFFNSITSYSHNYHQWQWYHADAILCDNVVLGHSEFIIGMYLIVMQGEWNELDMKYITCDEDTWIEWIIFVSVCVEDTKWLNVMDNYYLFIYPTVMRISFYCISLWWYEICDICEMYIMLMSLICIMEETNMFDAPCLFLYSSINESLLQMSPCIYDSYDIRRTSIQCM